MTDLFKLKKKTAQGQCEAMRCTDSVRHGEGVVAAAGKHWGREASVDLCPKHYETAMSYAEKLPGAPPDALALYADSMAEGAKVVGWTEQSAVGSWLARVHEVVSGLVALTEQGLRIAALAKNLPIESQADLTDVGEYVQEAKAQLKSIVDQEKEISFPVGTALKRIREFCRPARQAWADAEEILRAKLVAAKLREDERNRKAVVAAGQAHVDGGDATTALGMLTHTSDIAGVSLKLKWKAIVEDVALLPDEYVLRIPNEKKLKEYCAAVVEDAEPAPIPGVRFERDVVSRIQTVRGVS